jgi:SAM-dependent methyltransferase
MQLATGAWGTGILASGVIHSIFTHLAAGATTKEEVAQRAGLSERGTQVLLDGLTGLGLVDLIDGNYRNSPEASEFLVEGKPAYTGGYVKFTFADMSRWACMPEAVRMGAPLATDTADVTENPFWEQLVPAIAVLSVPSALTAADKLNLVNAGPISILDVGGGSGIYSIIWLGMNPEARSTQVDWKNVNQIALAAAAQQRIGARFRTLDGDFHTVDFGTNEHDVAIYSHIAHQETPAANTAVFRKLRNALKPGGTLVINDFVVNDDRTGPPFPLIFHSMMLLQSKHGATWREVDYRDWLQEAGFTDVTFVPTPSPATVVLAR